MKRTKLISYLLTSCIVCSLCATLFGTAVSAVTAEITAVTEDVPADNVLYKSDFDTVYSLEGVSAAKKSLEQVFTKTGAYLQLSKITANYSGFTITNPKNTIPAGNYKFTGYFRMMYVGEVTALRININDQEGSAGTVRVYPTSDEWMKVEYYVTIDSSFKNITICGDMDPAFIQPYCIDNISLVPVTTLPDGYTMPSSFGTKVSAAEAKSSQVDSLFDYPEYNTEFESRYDVQGVIVNLDADSFITSAYGAGEAALRAYALGYKDSHVTDFMICLNN